MNSRAGHFQCELPMVSSSSKGSGCVPWGSRVQEGCSAPKASQQAAVVFALDVLYVKPLYSPTYFCCFGNSILASHFEAIQ